MSIFEEAVQKVKEAQACLMVSAKKILAGIQKSTAPLSERWAEFKGISEYLPKDSWVMHMEIGGDEISWYDDAGVDRNEDVCLVSMAEYFEANLCHLREDVDQFKEDVIASGYSGFNNDW